MNDEALVAKFWARDPDAIAESKALYDTYCMYIAGNILHDREDAEECLNDALLAAWNSIPPQRPRNLKTYLGKLVREIAIDRWRRKHAQKRISEELLVPLSELEDMVGSREVEESAADGELSLRISDFLRSLKKTERDVFVRRYWFYDPIASICSRYGFSKGKVAMMLKRTRDKLAEYLEKEGYLK